MEGKTYEVRVHRDATSAFRSVGNPCSSFMQKRLAVPDANITVFDFEEKMRVIEGADIPEDATKIETVEAPDELVEAAQELIRSQIALNDMKDVFAKL